MVQEPNEGSDRGKWMGLAVQVSAVALQMALPGLIGAWLDQRLGTRFLVLAGVLIGLAIGIQQLLRLAAAVNRR